MINLIQDCIENLKRNIYRNVEFTYQTIYENVAVYINIRFISSIFSQLKIFFYQTKLLPKRFQINKIH